MKVSLILATLGQRAGDLGRFLTALQQQMADGVETELIIVDQSRDGIAPDLLVAGKVPTLHLRAAPGLSRARNLGLQHANGEVIGFPDDDCWYEPGVLAHVAEQFAADPLVAALCLRLAHGDQALLRGAGPDSQWLDLASAWRLCISPALFVRRSALQVVGGFDESLGLGSGTPWGAGEETDLLLRMLAAGLRARYLPVRVQHPLLRPGYTAKDREKASSYARGAGRVLRLRRCPPALVAGRLLRPLVASGLALAALQPAKARFYAGIFLGQLRGLSAAREAAASASGLLPPDAEAE